GGNPVFDAPADLEFTKHLDRVPLRVHLSLYDDETSELSHWHLPEAHFLEAWGDMRAADGTVTIQQPLILPLYGGKTAIEVMAALAGKRGRASYDAVRDYWHAKHGEADFEGWWRRAVHDGVVAGSAADLVHVALQPGWTDVVGADGAGEGAAYEIVL